MKFPGAPYGLKMACGENPKRVYGGKRPSPSTRMGNVAGYRAAWINAADYSDGGTTTRPRSQGDKKADAPEARPAARDAGRRAARRDPGGEPLLPGRRDGADDRYLPRSSATTSPPSTTRWRPTRSPTCWPRTTSAPPPGPTGGASRWRPSTPSRRTSPLVHAAGGCAMIHSDDADRIQRLNQEAAKALARRPPRRADHHRGRRDPWITANPAKALGIDAETGSLEPGKMADVVVWSARPVQRLRRGPSRSTSTARWPTTATTQPASRSPTSSSASATPAIAGRSNDAPPDRSAPPSLCPSLALPTLAGAAAAETVVITGAHDLTRSAPRARSATAPW